MSETIVTELIVDARPAQKAAADHAAAMRMAENSAGRMIAAQKGIQAFFQSSSLCLRAFVVNILFAPRRARTTP